MILLVEPALADKEQLTAYRASFLEDNETIHGGSGLETAETIEKWLELQEAYKSPATVPASHVISRVYLAKQADTVIGILNLRLELNDYLLQQGGHIGYSVKKRIAEKDMGQQCLLNPCRLPKASE
ncbi:GNAT family acetyltransferase [Enterococcus gallinarum]|nr:GNAT family acetyltransferase [Enterococcus gallinarum]MCW3744058.1 GNAT family acetyltransferase [Enterococcus gallinarum]